MPAAYRSGQNAQLPFPEDAEARMGIVLAKDGDPVDRKPFKTDDGEAVAQHPKHRLASRRVKPACQGHVKAEFIHDVRITPAVEILALAQRQPLRISPRAVGGREWRAE